MFYVLLGFPLLILSLANLNILLIGREVKEFVNRHIEAVKWQITIILITVLFAYVSAMILFKFQSEVSREVLIIAIITLWAALLIIEAINFKKFIDGGFKPGLSKDFFNYLVYFAVLALIFDRLKIPWISVTILSTIFVMVIVYFAVMLWRYSKITNMLPIPLDIYRVTVGIRLFSFSEGVILISYGHAESIYLGFTGFAFLVLVIVLWYTAMSMEKLVRM